MVKKTREGKATKDEVPRSPEITMLNKVFKSIHDITNTARRK